mmetsp:Transcript_12404/g.35486  ORF Transcript_12404/g.35486 Transcript_12404/m.35486 type:complete len:492 (-) Transcript_12404:47-1522(-)
MKVAHADNSARKLSHYEESSSDEDDDDERDVLHNIWLQRVCKPWVLCAVAVAVVLFFITGPVSRRIAELVIDNIGMHFDTIDMGVMNGSSVLHPKVSGWVAPTPLPCSAMAKMKHTSVWAHIRHSEEEHTRIGLISIPDIRMAPFQQIELDMTTTLRVEVVENLGLAGDNFIVADSTSWRVKGLVDIKVWVFGFIPMYLGDIPMDKEIELKGMASFSQQTNPITMTDIISADGQYDGLGLDVAVVLHNPSFLSASIPSEMIFGVETRGQKFGIATINGMRLGPGDNAITLHFKLLNGPDHGHAVEEFMGGYIRGEEQAITTIGNRRSSLDPLIGVILQDVKLDFTFVPPPTDFVQNVVARVSPTGLNAKVKVYNPLPKAITLGGIDLEVFLKDVPDMSIFTLDSSQSQTRVPGTMLQPKQITEIVINLSIFGAKIGALTEIKKIIEAAESGNIVVTVRGPVTFTVDPAFAMTVPYTGSGLECHLGWCVFCV